MCEMTEALREVIALTELKLGSRVESYHHKTKL